MYEKYVGRKVSNDELLKKAEDIQSRALKVVDYLCIKRGAFIESRMSYNTEYYKVIENIKEKKCVDIGCCMGTDLRKLIIDGAQPSNVIGVDQHREFWDLGMELYEDNKKENTPLNDRFVNLSVLDDSFPVNLKNFATKKISSFDSFDVVYLGSVLHLFAEANVEKCLANILKVLKSGGQLFGQTVGNETPTEAKSMRESGGLRYLHSPGSLKQLMERLGYENVKMTWREGLALNMSYGFITFFATKK